jgi:hypothetical protein
MTADHEAAIRAATDALAAAILAAVRAEAVSNDAGLEQLLSIDQAAVHRLGTVKRSTREDYSSSAEGKPMPSAIRVQPAGTSRIILPSRYRWRSVRSASGNEPV